MPPWRPGATIGPRPRPGGATSSRGWIITDGARSARSLGGDRGEGPSMEWLRGWGRIRFLLLVGLAILAGSVGTGPTIALATDGLPDEPILRLETGMHTSRING